MIMEEKLLLLGDEALAQGALDAGMSGCYAYPGTPSTEIMEYVQRSPEAKERNVHRIWSANEKTSLESALGMSYAGKRTIACMKHVGLNVAADPFMNAGMVGANGVWGSLPGGSHAFGFVRPAGHCAGLHDSCQDLRPACGTAGGCFYRHFGIIDPAIPFLYGGYLHELLHLPGVVLCGVDRHHPSQR